MWAPWHHVRGSSPGAGPIKAQSPEHSPTPRHSSTPIPDPTSGIHWTLLPIRSWRSFGIARVDRMPKRVLSVIFDQNLSFSNKWAGIIASTPASCHYSIEMWARVTHQFAGSQSGGYGIASGSLTRRSLPEAKAFQYDFGFAGYRLLTYPKDWQTPYHYVQAPLDHRWHRVLVEFASSMTAYVDGRQVIRQTDSRSCGSPIIRVWSATVELRDIRMGQL